MSRVLVLIGAEGVIPGIGTAMVHVAGRLRQTLGEASVWLAFADRCHPTIDDVAIQIAQSGAEEVILQPYALHYDRPIRQACRRLMRHLGAQRPHLRVQLSQALGAHPLIAELAHQRALEAAYLAAHAARGGDAVLHAEQLAAGFGRSRRSLAPASASPRATSRSAGLLLLSTSCARTQRECTARSACAWLRLRSEYRQIELCELHDRAAIQHAIEAVQRREVSELVIVPYALQLTLAEIATLEEVCALAAAAGLNAILAQHLGYDRRIADAIAERACSSNLRAPARA